jgi:peroxiredoxin
VKVGEPAPEFTLPYLGSSSPGGKVERKEFKLADYKGKGEVVLAFFPAAFSPG